MRPLMGQRSAQQAEPHDAASSSIQPHEDDQEALLLSVLQQQQLGQQLTPLEFIHWLYLQPPADAEVLVQACGRSFVTSWDPVHQHWLTQELPPDCCHLPEHLPRISHVDVPCIAAHPQHSSDLAAAAAAAAGPTAAASTDLACHKLLLYGTALSSPDASFAACLHGQYLQVESRPIALPLGTSSTTLTHSLSPAGSQTLSISPPQATLQLTNPAQGAVSPSQPTSPKQQQQQQQQHQDCVELTVYGVTQPGLLQLECWCGRLLTCRKQVAVVREPAVQRELAQYFGCNTSSTGALSADALLDWSGFEASSSGFLLEPPPSLAAAGSAAGGGDLHEERKVDDLMTDLGCWVDFVAAMQQLCAWLQVEPAQLQAADTAATQGMLARRSWRGARSARRNAATAGSTASATVVAGPTVDLSQPLLQACLTPAYRAQMVDTAVQLLTHSCSSAWVETAGSLVSDLVLFGLDFREIKHRAQAAASSSLLHCAVCSKSPRMIRAVWDWGVRYGPLWTWAEADPRNGITPLHMAAALDALPTLSGGLATQRLLLNSSTSTGRVSSVGSTLADWILQEYQAAYQFWHGAEDCRGMTPADVAERHSFSTTPVGSSIPDEALPGDAPAVASPTVTAAEGERLNSPYAGTGALPFGSNLGSGVDSMLDDDGPTTGSGILAAGSCSRRATCDLSAVITPTATILTERNSTRMPVSMCQADSATTSPIAPTAATPARQTSSSRAAAASVQKWVELQQLMAASQQPPAGPPDLAGNWDPPPLDAASDLQLAHRTRGPHNADASSPGTVAVSPERPLKQRAQGNQQQQARQEHSRSGMLSSTSDYQALVSALHLNMSRTRRDSQQQQLLVVADDAPASASHAASASQAASGRSNVHWPAGPGHASSQDDAGALERVNSSSSNSRSRDVQMLMELLSPQQLLSASVYRFRSRRLEGGFELWLERRRRFMRQLLPACMVLMILAIALKEAMQPLAAVASVWLGLGLHAMPWAWMLITQQYERFRSRSQPATPRARLRHHVYRQPRLSDEQAWLSIMLWHLLVRSLQAAGTLRFPTSALALLRAGGDCLCEGFMQVLFQVRPQQLVVLRMLYALSSAALYMRVGTFTPFQALLAAAFWNLLCLAVAWVLDICNRRAYLLQLLSRLQRHPQPLQRTLSKQSSIASSADGSPARMAQLQTTLHAGSSQQQQQQQPMPGSPVSRELSMQTLFQQQPVVAGTATGSNHATGAPQAVRAADLAGQLMEVGGGVGAASLPPGAAVAGGHSPAAPAHTMAAAGRGSLVVGQQPQVLGAATLNAGLPLAAAAAAAAAAPGHVSAARLRRHAARDLKPGW